MSEPSVFAMRACDSIAEVSTQNSALSLKESPWLTTKRAQNWAAFLYRCWGLLARIACFVMHAWWCNLDNLSCGWFKCCAAAIVISWPAHVELRLVLTWTRTRCCSSSTALRPVLRGGTLLSVRAAMWSTYTLTQLTRFGCLTCSRLTRWWLKRGHSRTSTAFTGHNKRRLLLLTESRCLFHWFF